MFCLVMMYRSNMMVTKMLLLLCLADDDTGADADAVVDDGNGGDWPLCDIP